MENTLLIGLSRQMALQRGLDVIANNVANLNTPGFKADEMVFEESRMPSARGDGWSGPDRRVSFVADRATWHDMRSGPVQQTGNPLDVALDGNAFLAVQTPRGERYTRNGALALNAAGELVTSQGFRVLSDAGPIVFQPQDRAISIGRDGSIASASGPRGKLRVVEFAQPDRLQKDGTSTFAAPAGVQPQAATTAGVHQGALEKSNVEGVIEMTRMIEATRTYTTISQLLQNQGDLRRSAIDKLAEVPA
jgi:flagellar basal-body rod protein FlgF/flagellar basal-body rod protein FlgG